MDREDMFEELLAADMPDDPNTEYIELKRDASTYSSLYQLDQQNDQPVPTTTQSAQPPLTSSESSDYFFDDQHVFVHGSRVPPDRSLAQVPLQKPIKDYLVRCGIDTISEADGYHWANIIRRMWPVFIRISHSNNNFNA